MSLLAAFESFISGKLVGDSGAWEYTTGLNAKRGKLY